MAAQISLFNFSEEELAPKRSNQVKNTAVKPPWSCGLCDATFFDRMLLREHRHEKPLICYLWMKKKENPDPNSTLKMREMVPYEPDENEKRRSIPTLACHLWNNTKDLYRWSQAIKEIEDRNGVVSADHKLSFYFFLQSERTCSHYLQLLVKCGLEEDKIRSWARIAWHRAKTGYSPLFEWPKEAPALLAELGYKLGPGEFIGWKPPMSY